MWKPEFGLGNGQTAVKVKLTRCVKFRTFDVLDSAMFLCRHNQVQTSFRCHYVVINEVTLLDFVIFHLGRLFLYLAR